MSEARKYFATVYGLGESPGQGCQATLDVTPVGVALHPVAGKSVVLSYDEIIPSTGGAEGDHLVLTVGDPQAGGLAVYISDRTSKRQIERQASPRLQERLRAMSQQKSARERRRFASWAVSLTVFVVLCWGGWLAYGLMVNAAVGRIPLKWEKELGQLAIKAAMADKKVINAPPVGEGLDRIVKRLQGAANDQPYRFHVQVVDDPQVNAFAVPGGEIVVMRGLICAAETPEEVAGVLAHEMQHVIQRHGLRQMVHSIGIFAIAQILLGGGEGMMAILRGQAPRLLSMKHSREQETAADVEGVKLLRRAGISPEGLLHFFQRLAKDEGDAREALSFISTHPASKHRTEMLKKMISDQSPDPALPLQLDWKSVQRGCKC